MPDQATQQQLVQAAVDGLHLGRQLALDHDRNDLAGALDRARATLNERSVGVAVVGEFKCGKSTLINALLQTAVCPVDADQVTVVPTVVRYGHTRSATAYLENSTPRGGEPSGRGPHTEPVMVEQIAEYVSEAGNPGNRRRLRSVEVRMPHKMLRTGLCLIDTPGVGGLDSAYGFLTLGVLGLSDGMLFVTDASQELTEPELDFLRQALDRCPLAACVVTKTDLYPGWRRIVALDERHLAGAGLDVPVIAVSSYLRLASDDDAATQESGYLVLGDFLASTVLRNANASAVASAARDVEFVAGQIGAEIQAEETILNEPAQAERVIARLAATRTRTAELASSTATWQQTLSDGVEDLFAQVGHDLQERLRGVLHDVKDIIDAGDPMDSWDDIEAWLRQRAAAVAVENYDLLAERTRELAGKVSESFEPDGNGPDDPAAGRPSDRVALIDFSSAQGLTPPGGRFGTMLMATRTALFVPMVLFGVAGSLLGVLIAAPLMAGIGGLIGVKIIRDEKQRQVAYRRQQANMAAHRYVEEVGFILNKESKDALRGTQRYLRDYFQQRARALYESSSTALRAAQRAKTMSEPERAHRGSQLAVEADQLRVVTGSVAQLVAMASQGGAGTGG